MDGELGGMALNMDSVFVCQKCRKPIKIVTRKGGLKECTLLSLRSADPSDAAIKKKETEAIKALGESFVVLSDTKKDSKNPRAPNFHAQVQALTKIFEVVSDNCQIDCPICDHCHGHVQKILRRKIADIKEESEGFKKCIAELSKTSSNMGESSQDEKKELEQERKLSREVEKQIEEIHREREKLNAVTSKLEREAKQLEKFEQSFWEEFQELQLEAINSQEKIGSIEQRIELTKQKLEQLECTNVYNDAFYISLEGHFGTINGFRLGRLRSEHVEWDEINAALGQVVLLLKCIAKQVKFEFKSVDLYPMGSYSKIADRRKPEVMNELHNYNSNEFFLRQGSSSSSAGKRFHTALNLLLRAVMELGDFGERMDKSFRLPKRIKNDKIEGLSIQTVAAESDWTKAMRYLLLNLKVLLAWCSKYSASGGAYK